MLAFSWILTAFDELKMVKKKGVLFFLVLLFFVVSVKIFVPTYFLLYDDVDEFRDVDGHYYLAKYDSFFYLGDVIRGVDGRGLSFVGIGIYGLFGSLGLFWLPVFFGVLSCVVFYFVARKLFGLWPAFFASLFFAFHPSSFFASAKGVFDTDFVIQFFEVCLIFSFFLFSKRKSWVFLVLSISCGLSFFWDGWMFFLVLSVLVCVSVLAIKFGDKSQWIASSMTVIVLVGSFLKVLDRFGFAINITNQLRPYNFLCLFDVVTLPLVFVLLGYYFFRSDDKFRTHLIFPAFCFVAVLGLFFMRFYYLAVPFVALGLGFVLDKVKKPFLLGFGIVLFTLVFSNINQPLIFVEDSIVDAVNDVDTGVVLGLWDLGNVYYGVSLVDVRLRAAPSRIDEFTKGMFLEPDVAIEYLDLLGYYENYSLVITSYDLEKFEVLSGLVGPRITNGSMFKNFGGYFELQGFYDGVNTDLWVWKRKNRKV